jgi:hypothetical protein
MTTLLMPMSKLNDPILQFYEYNGKIEYTEHMYNDY